MGKPRNLWVFQYGSILCLLVRHRANWKSTALWEEGRPTHSIIFTSGRRAVKFVLGPIDSACALDDNAHNMQCNSPWLSAPVFVFLLYLTSYHDDSLNTSDRAGRNFSFPSLLFCCHACASSNGLQRVLRCECPLYMKFKIHSWLISSVDFIVLLKKLRKHHLCRRS